MGNKTGCVNANDTRTATGLFPGVVLNVVLLAQAQIGLHLRGRPRDADDAGLKPGRYKCPNKAGANRPAGTREALPGTICETFVPHFLRRTLAAVPVFQRNSLAVRKHLLDAGHVRFTHQRQLLELAHTAWGLRAHQVALAGVAALDLAVRRELEALPRAAESLQLQFRFRCVSWHFLKSSPELDALHASRHVLKSGLGCQLGRSMLRPYKSRNAHLMALITAIAGRWTIAGPRAWRRSRPFSARAMLPGRCLPCAAWSRSGPGRQFPSASGSSWHARLPGEPFRARDEKSSRALCGLRRGTAGSGSCEPDNSVPRWRAGT